MFGLDIDLFEYACLAEIRFLNVNRREEKEPCHANRCAVQQLKAGHPGQHPLLREQPRLVTHCG